MVVKAMMPKLRFRDDDGREFPGWRDSKLLDIAPLQRGFDLPVSNIKKGKFPVVFSNGILKHHDEFKVCGPGVVTGRSGTIGKVTFVEHDFWPHNTSLWVTDFKNNSPKFIYYFYCHLDLSKFGTGSGVPTLNRNDVHREHAYVPQSQEEQTKIANFLSAVDAKISQLTKKRELLALYKKGVMQKIFSQELRFKDDKEQDFSRWKYEKLSKLAKIYDGTHMTPDYKETGVPFYSVEHLTSDNFQNTKYISEEVFEKENMRVRLEKGDILMTRIGDIGTSKYIDWEVNASFYVSLALIKSENISSKYLAHFIRSSFFQNELYQRTIHVAFPKKINLGEIGECQVLIPTEAEQAKIASFLTAIDDKITNVKSQLGAAKEYKQGLLQQMFV